MKKELVLLVACGILAAFAPPPVDYFSIKDGDFEDVTVWSTVSHIGPTCSCAAGCSVGNNEDVFIAHVMTTTCSPLDIEGGGELVIESGGSLTLPLDASVTGNGDITIEPGGAMVIPGDLDISGNGNVTVDGTLTVGGDINTSGSGTLCGTGTVILGGGTSGSGVCGTVTIIPGGAGLPIDLISFTAEPSDNQVMLNWVTGSERDNEYFTVERSTNGLSFEGILEVPGAINSTETLEYSAYDDNPINGLAYYRLRQTDLNGDYDISEIVAVDMSVENVMNDDCVLSVNPNPCQGNCAVMLSNCPENAMNTIVVDVIDASGNKVASHVPMRDFNGSFNFQIDKDNNLRPGIYIVVGNSETEAYSTKMISK